MLAGSSSRFGKNKLLIQFGEKKLCEYILDLVYHFNFYDVLVVYNNDKIKSLAKERKFRCIYNAYAENGMGTSIKIGTENTDSSSDGYLFLSGDRPFLNSKHLYEIVEKHLENKDKIIVPFFNDRSSSPCLFPSIFKQDILLLGDNDVGKKVVKNNLGECVGVDFDDDIAALDIDTESDYQNALRYIIPNTTKSE